MAPKTLTSSEVYLLPLNDDGSPQVAGGYLYIAAKTHDPITVRFRIEGTSSICRHGSLWVNIPLQGHDFQRHNFREYHLVPNFSRDIEISIPVYLPGAYAYYVTYAPLPELSADLGSSKAISKAEAKTKSEIFYIDVAPRLRLDERPLPLPALSVFSVISKFMGRYPNDWEKHLRGISDRGYNMIHFTPLQVRGKSNSPYSLYDQLGWDPDCFPAGEKDVQKMVQSLEQKHSLLSLTDIVLNHTADNSEWLLEHPEVGYNLTTAPWLESAYLLDTALLELGDSLQQLGLPTLLKSSDDLTMIMEHIKTEVFGKLRLWEFFVLDIKRDAEAAVVKWASGHSTRVDLEQLRSSNTAEQAEYVAKHGLLDTDRLGERFRRKLDPKVGAAVLDATLGNFTDSNKEAGLAKLQEYLDIINVRNYQEYDSEINTILDQLFNRIKYCRLDEHGPQMGEIGAKSPLIESYFTRLPQDKRTSRHKQKDLALANNGWVWAGNALVDNAGPDTRVYLRREVIVWGDCVKLRYGSKPEDSPYLWDRMTKYARMLAKYFAGLRIDNCHSTPIHVAEHILDEARRVRPDLYVVAELFSGSEEMDYLFVKRLGLSSLIREAMQAWSTAELSRLVHRHGGRPIGSFEVDEVSKSDSKTSEIANGSNGDEALSREIVRHIRPVPVQALFMDCTHDNETPAQKRDARDTLPNAALVSMCASASGSVMGYDEIYPKLVDLVSETRLYTSESSSDKEIKIGGGKNGIGSVKKFLNQIHSVMGLDGYDETHIHHEDQYITVHRVHPESRKGYFLIAHTAFPGYGNGNGGFSPVHLSGTKARHCGSWTLEVDADEDTKRDVLKDPKYLRGLPSKVVAVPGIRLENKGDDTIITVREKFPPGSIAVFETWIPAADHSVGLDNFLTSGADEAFGDLDLTDLNFLLYKCEAEERDVSGGADGVYDIPGHGKTVYAGLQGWWSIFKDIIRDNNLAHPACQNLRDGQWILDYILGRLERSSANGQYPRLAQPTLWLTERFDAIRTLPSFLLPRYFGLILRTAYTAAWNQSLSLMTDNIQHGQWFLQSLAMVSVQQVGIVKSASLYPSKQVPAIAAGLPHFAVEWARCWGRDVFISLRGLLIGTGRFQEAKEHICAFASVLKHGMIPNLLDSGRTPRYNSRDSVWFFLQCIQDYVKLAPDGSRLLKVKVKRRFLPYDDIWFSFEDARAYTKESSIEDIIQEILERHAQGMSFREANAGPQIDSQMTDHGFNIEIKTDWKTGMIFGGSQHNCGTWMDKMGESEKAGSKGVPGTPRDGCAIEICGLHYSTLRWIESLHKKGLYSHSTVKKSDGTTATFKSWADLIKHNFERCFYVPLDKAHDGDYDVNPEVVNRRGTYKDLYRSGKEYEDYQLRPNVPIAMTVAPDLFNPQHAMHALVLMDEVLRGPSGMATLDPADLNYRPYYVNSEDSTDFATSKGRNYHQGPEWLWPTGFFLRALLKFDLARRDANDHEGRTEAFQQATKRLAGCKTMIKESPWAGLAELTQKDGQFCGDSCPTQAWSASCLIDLYMDAAEAQSQSVV